VTGILLAAVAAVVVGSGDFLGGLAGRRTEPWSVVGTGFLAGTVVMSLIAAMVGGQPTAADLGWGAASGAGGAAGVYLLYRGFSRAPMGVVSPLAAVLGGLVPASAGLLTGDAVSVTMALGMGIGLVAIILVSWVPVAVSEAVWVGVRHGIGAGLGFGFLLLFLARAGRDAGLWPVLVSRAASFAILALASGILGRSLFVSRKALVPALAAGVLTVLGNAGYVLALNLGSLAPVSIVYSLFPASTVVLAWLVFRERLRPGQAVGVGLALLGTALITVG